MRADRERCLCQMRHQDERGRHAAAAFPTRSRAGSATDRLSDLGIGKRTRNHTMSTDRVDTGADDAVEILSVTGNGNRQ